eukprot:11267-Rhodomonas_salina.2
MHASWTQQLLEPSPPASKLADSTSQDPVRVAEDASFCADGSNPDDVPNDGVTPPCTCTPPNEASRRCLCDKSADACSPRADAGAGWKQGGTCTIDFHCTGGGKCDGASMRHRSPDFGCRMSDVGCRMSDVGCR